MPHADIKIIRLGDEPPWPDLHDKQLDHRNDEGLTVAILEAGMSSGLPSVALRIEVDDERTILIETSLAIWSAVTIAARGAFPQAFDGGPLQV